MEKAKAGRKAITGTEIIFGTTDATGPDATLLIDEEFGIFSAILPSMVIQGEKV